MSKNVSWLFKRCEIWWKYQIYPSVVSFRTIQSFDHLCILNMFMIIESCQTQTHILIDFLLTNDDSNDEILKTLNLYLAFGQKIFLKLYRDENSQDAISSC